MNPLDTEEARTCAMDLIFQLQTILGCTGLIYW